MLETLRWEFSPNEGLHLSSLYAVGITVDFPSIDRAVFLIFLIISRRKKIAIIDSRFRNVVFIITRYTRVIRFTYSRLKSNNRTDTIEDECELNSRFPECNHMSNLILIRASYSVKTINCVIRVLRKQINYFVGISRKTRKNFDSSVFGIHNITHVRKSSDVKL